MQIGTYQISPPLALAPMAGVTDKPFRMLCKQLGAGLAVSEMTHSDPRLWKTRKSQQRMDHVGEPDPISVQIAGTEPWQLAEAARFNVDHGAQIIDINMGCPAKKVCHAWAGSALMCDEVLVGKILEAVVKAVNVPVTLKTRTGWARAHRNGVAVARIAEASGIAALAVHGRTREDLYQGEAEYDTIAEIRAAVSLPLWVNGDIDSPQKAAEVMRRTGADGVMIGRAAQGRPWIFREVAHFLQTGQLLAAPNRQETAGVLLGHLRALYEFYGPEQGLRIARKHLGWYAGQQGESTQFRARVNDAQDITHQYRLAEQHFAQCENVPANKPSRAA